MVGNGMIRSRQSFQQGLGVAIGLLALCVILAGCTNRENRLTFDGNYYPTREKGVSRDDRQAFEVTVRRADRGVDGAREAGRHGGSKYCIENFGTSEIDWTSGPDDAVETLRFNNGNLILSGRCVTW